MSTLLKSKAINEWNLFFLISIPMCIIIFMNMMDTNMSTGEGISHMIGFSVRIAVPLLFIVVAASSYQILFPSPLGKWWLRNRKYIGFCFALAMAWQGAFIFTISNFTRDYYFEEIYLMRDELEGTVGYIFLAGMIVTSFAIARKQVNPMQWKLIQKGGIYFLWCYAFTVYWWNLFYYPMHEPFPSPELHDYIFYWMGFTAMALRIAAWGKKRLQRANKKSSQGSVPFLYQALGSIFIIVGLVGSATADYWFNTVNGFMTGSDFTTELVLWLPFWPYEPFMPLLILGLGTLMVTRVKA